MFYVLGSIEKLHKEGLIELIETHSEIRKNYEIFKTSKLDCSVLFASLKKEIRNLHKISFKKKPIITVNVKNINFDAFINKIIMTLIYLLHTEIINTSNEKIKYLITKEDNTYIIYKYSRNKKPIRVLTLNTHNEDIKNVNLFFAKCKINVLKHFNKMFTIINDELTLFKLLEQYEANANNNNYHNYDDYHSFYQNHDNYFNDIA